jgi:transaldolase
MVAQMVSMKNRYEFKTEVLCASVRTQQHIQKCIAIGVDVVTCPFSFVKTFYQHPQTEEGLQAFLADYHGQ